MEKLPLNSILTFGTLGLLIVFFLYILLLKKSLPKKSRKQDLEFEAQENNLLPQNTPPPTMVTLSMMMQTVVIISLLFTTAGIFLYHQLWAPDIRTYDVREQLRLLTIEAMQTNMPDIDMEKNIRRLESNVSALPGNIVVIEKGAVVGKKKDEIELHFPTDRKEKQKSETPTAK